MKRNLLISLTLIGLISLACAPRKTVKEESTETAQVPHEETPELNIRGSEFQSVSELKTTYFEYDRYELDQNARKTLQNNAALLKRNPGWEVLIEGHCDERGTTQYNLALGQKRAKAAREYYVHLGVSGNKLATISYGKEKPNCAESNDACWSKNRRVETKVRARTVNSNQEKSDTP
ncbi:MAG: peptidoglycan-associated lipoprotein Pal [Elusimicrobia bacterium]|nr:peptidoglycan-associated lipoprotein Pal [Elusimicrobiota bacterium]